MPVLSTLGSAAFVKGRVGLFLYPLRNTAVNPTNTTWRAANPGVTFTPNVGLSSETPITNMTSMFFGNTTFNDSDIALWDVVNVNTMLGMFYGDIAFNQPIGNWNVSNVTNMNGMFGADGGVNMTFNQPIGNWNVSNVTDMSGMLNNCVAFNQNIGSWNVSNVTSMSSMFFRSSAFNCGQASGVAHNLMQRTATGGWRTNNVSNMDDMFRSAFAFNGNLSAWCVTNIPTVPSRFAGANVNFTTARQPQWGTCTLP